MTTLSAVSLAVLTKSSICGRTAYGTSPWNAVLKDKLENRLHKEMCARHITLKQAREMLINDWRDAYKRYYGDP